jgi:hypothetical protein
MLEECGSHVIILAFPRVVVAGCKAHASRTVKLHSV